jgi:hypothetical protein
MKKILLSAIGMLIMGSSFAQTTSLLTKTCYRGAFAPAPTPMWTDTWTEWDPQNKVYPSANFTVTGNITSNTTWTTGQVILLSTQCFVKNNSILTIQPGVIVLGDKSVTGAGLFITKGSQVIANGTASQPIVFTSNQAPGQRGLGDWGGIILMGKASNNNPNGINNIEGLPVSADTEYGGGTTPDDNDNSGSLKYIRIEFGGYVYQPNKEINGLTFGAVGRGTTIDYIQVSFANDDAFEWFGGSVNCRHLVAYRSLDDDWDTDNGFRGTVQFGLGVRDPQISDNPSVSTSEGFESDNDPNGTTTDPNTSAIFSNITDIGPLRGVLTATYASGFRRGARIRRNSSLRIINSILMDHATRGVYIDGNLSESNAAGTSSNTIVFKNNILAGYGQRATESQTASTAFNSTINAWVAAYNDTLKTSVNILTTPYNYTAPDYRPAPGSIAMSGASFTDVIISANTSTVIPNVAASITTSSVCIGFPTGSLTPYTFAPSTTVDPGYCALSWSAPAGMSLSSSTAINPTFTVSTLGTFVATLSVTHQNSAKTVTVSITTYTCSDVSVKTNSATFNNIQLFPNPSSDMTQLSVNSDVLGALSVYIRDLTGKMVAMPLQNQILNAGQNILQLSTMELNNGIYFVTLECANSKETVKLVVNH